MIVTLIIGFIVGVIAKLFMPGKNPGGCLITALLGIAGAWVGQRLLIMMGIGGTVGFIGSVIGAMVILAIYHLIRKA